MSYYKEQIDRLLEDHNPAFSVLLRLTNSQGQSCNTFSIPLDKLPALIKLLESHK